MLYYTQFVVVNLAECRYPWSARNRSDTGLRFFESLGIFWLPPLMGFIATTLFVCCAREDLWLLSPILVGWLVAPVLAWVTSQPRLGEWARRHRLFLVPEEKLEFCPAELLFVEGGAQRSEVPWSFPHGVLPVLLLIRSHIRCTSRFCASGQQLARRRKAILRVFVRS